MMVPRSGRIARRCPWSLESGLPPCSNGSSFRLRHWRFWASAPERIDIAHRNNDEHNAAEADAGLPGSLTGSDSPGSSGHPALAGLFDQ